jgi:hypothetical protein
MDAAPAKMDCESGGDIRKTFLSSLFRVVAEDCADGQGVAHDEPSTH